MRLVPSLEILGVKFGVSKCKYIYWFYLQNSPFRVSRKLFWLCIFLFLHCLKCTKVFGAVKKPKVQTFDCIGEDGSTNLGKCRYNTMCNAWLNTGLHIVGSSIEWSRRWPWEREADDGWLLRVGLCVAPVERGPSLGNRVKDPRVKS